MISKLDFATPEEAEQAFYDAFRSADLNAMQAVWADGEFIECIHPMADRAQGQAAVRDSWRRIFDSGLRIQLTLSAVNRTQDALLAVHVVYEHLNVEGRELQYPPVIATNIYQLIDGGWRMVLHHASPAPAPAEEQEDQEENEEIPHDSADERQLH